jgi:DNA helicase-2/ATP-dependent DNA helicase PcrA
LCGLQTEEKMDKFKDLQPSLNQQQQEAVSHGEGPLLISAGAGSGKTRTLTQRVIKLIDNGVLPERIVAITFTNKAADEIKARLRSNFKDLEVLPFLGTFHSFGARILRNEAQLVGRENNYVIFDNDDSERVLKKTIRDMELSIERYPVGKVQRKVSFIKDELADYSELEEPFRSIFEKYEERLKLQNAFDFDDLIEKPVRILQKNKEVLKKYQDRFEYILVDEFQDINTSQYALVRLLAHKHKNLNVVGDDNQSIYKFRGADFRNFINFEKDWPEAKIVHLGENYRSSKNIVDAAASLIKNNKLQRPKHLWTSNDEGEPVIVLASWRAEEEAVKIVNELLKDNLGSSAILYRTNAQSRAIEQALNFNSIPYEIFGGLKFYERKEIKDIVAALRYAMNPKDEISLERLHKTFRKKEFLELQEKLPALGEKLSPIELIGFVIKTSQYESYLENKFDNYEERLENVVELINFASNFQTLIEFVERISLLESSDRIKQDTNIKRVKLMTIHLSKGLEFDNVIIAGFNEGIIPHQRSLLSKDDIEEERRLMYVAMTRARKKLTLSFYGLASRFLQEIPPELIEFDAKNTWGDEDDVNLI